MSGNDIWLCTVKKFYKVNFKWLVKKGDKCKKWHYNIMRYCSVAPKLVCADPQAYLELHLGACTNRRATVIYIQESDVNKIIIKKRNSRTANFFIHGSPRIYS